MMPKPTGEEFTYTFKSEISNDRLADYKKLQERMDHAALKFEGYLGQELRFVPSPSNNGYSCIARVTFISLQLCLTWLDSTERRHILNDAEALLSYEYDSLLEPHSFDQWLNSCQGMQTPVWKINLLVWLALYPSVMILMLIGQNSLGVLPLPLNMLISNAITVAITGWFLVPWLSKRYGRWLQTKSKRLNAIYTTSVIGFLLLFLLFFSSLNDA
jgi:antibiotic biosynthesis monooxygenase (ABM) superfamily enzyme